METREKPTSAPGRMGTRRAAVELPASGLGHYPGATEGGSNPALFTGVPFTLLFQFTRKAPEHLEPYPTQCIFLTTHTSLSKTLSVPL